MADIVRRDHKKRNLSRGLFNLIHRKNKTLPIPVTNVTIPVKTKVSRRISVAPKPWPVFHLSDWITTCFNVPEFSGFFVLGGKKVDQLQDVEAMLSRFWDRYVHVDRDSLPQVPARTVPFFLHGDEGRGLVKRPIMILAFQPVVGWGGESHSNTIKYPGLGLSSRFKVFCFAYLSSKTLRYGHDHLDTFGSRPEAHLYHEILVYHLALRELRTQFSIPSTVVG